MLKHITRIAYKQPPEKGDKGERGARTRQIVWAAGIEFYSGADGEAYADFAYYNGQVYQCTKHHTSSSNETPYDSVENNTGYWRLVPSFANFSTKVLLLGTGKEGWIMDEGVIKHTSGKIQLMADGSIRAAGGETIVSKDGLFTTKGAVIEDSTLKDVIVYGTLRQPFAHYSGDWEWDGTDEKSEAQLHDNLQMEGGGSLTIAAGGFPWDSSQNGRRITVMTHRYGGVLSSGAVSITAPNGKYFFQDGAKYGELVLSSREYVELLGIGEGATFYGWLITNRGNIETTKSYGRSLNVLAHGTVTGRTSNGTCSMSYKTFDGRTLQCQRTANGRYTVWIPTKWNLQPNDYLVMLTGVGYIMDSSSNSSPVKATLTAKTASYFIVDISDDDSWNNGSFEFQIINMNDFTYNGDIKD